MGREAVCTCEWAGSKNKIKAVIEPPHLILRGEIRKRIPLAQLKRVRAENNLVRFIANDEAIALDLGDEAKAARWAKALVKEPPSLATKLGITAESAVWMIGKLDDPAIDEALAAAKKVSPRAGDLILARVNSPAELEAALEKAAEALDRSTPIWLIYPKGPVHALNESLVRAAGLASGIVDTKVAAVSAALTALRFVKRKR